MHDAADYVKLPAHVLVVDVTRYLTIDTVFSLVDYLQYYAEVLEGSSYKDPALCAQLNELSAYLASLGSMQTSVEALQDLNRDLITLFTAPTASKTREFIAKHKKAMVIGTAAAAAVDAAAPPLRHEDNTHSLTILHTHHDKVLSDESKEVGARLAHKIWDRVADASMGLLECVLATPPTNTRMQHDPRLAELWRQDILTPGHSKIDAWFEQYVVHSAPVSSHHDHSMLYSFIPPPKSILEELEAIVHIVKSHQLDEWLPFVEDFATRHQKSLPLPFLPPIELAKIEEAKPPPFVYCAEVEKESLLSKHRGKEIRRFDIDKMLQDNRVNHLFGKSSSHLDKIGMSPQEAYDMITHAVIEADKEGRIEADHPFKISVKINNCNVEARGIVVNGELRYSSFFFPKS
jgi:hypothetical protein